VSYGAIATPEAEGTGVAVEASFLALRMAFKVWNIRKVYLEVPEFNLAPILSGVGRVFHDEGRRREHLYYDGRWWDLVTLAVYRADLDELSRIIDPFLARPVSGPDREGGPHEPVATGC
jgi:RimJ/RimL family protein N-acetyltransferase